MILGILFFVSNLVTSWSRLPGIVFLGAGINLLIYSRKLVTTGHGVFTLLMNHRP